MRDTGRRGLRARGWPTGPSSPSHSRTPATSPKGTPAAPALDRYAAHEGALPAPAYRAGTLPSEAADLPDDGALISRPCCPA